MYYEDFHIGDEFTTEAFGFSAEQIIEFGNTYDPQPFHTDTEAARASIYGGLIASGWQVLSAAFGAVVRFGLFEEGGQGAGGLDEVHWTYPVRPGDTLRCRVEILDMRPSKTRTDRGYVNMRFTIQNQNGQDVAGFRCDEIILKRPG